MKVIIAGSRTLRDPQVVEIAMIEARVLGIIPTIVISGGQRSWDDKNKQPYGTDYFGEEWARARGIPTIKFLANWHRFGPSAGPRRNAEMVAEGDALVACWDTVSSGTDNIIGLARHAGLLLYVRTFP
jgi:hypothetical protein